MNIFTKNLFHRRLSIFLLLTLYVGLCFEAAAFPPDVMAVGELHELEGGYSIAAIEADVDGGAAVFVLYKEGRVVDKTEPAVSRDEWFVLDDIEWFDGEGTIIFYFKATLGSLFRSEDTIMVHLTDYNWGPIPTPVITPAPATPTSTPIPAGPGFSFYLIIFLVFCLAIGLPLIFIIYRRGKPPSGGSTQQKPSEPDEDYAQKIDEYKEKMEEWEKEGYDVSELKEVLEEVKNERK